MTPYGRQNINEEDIKAVTDVLKSDYLTQGPLTPIFEEKIQKYTSASYSVAVVNATAALHIACLSLELGEGDFLWTSPISFVASANCALYCGAEVDFVDIDPISYNICPNALEKKLKIAKKNGKLPKIVVPVHFSGQSCDMLKIKELSKKYGFKIIEDASHAIGGEYRGKKIGCCEYSDITVFSFHPVKIITTCEGGICLTNDSNLYDRLLKLRSHGITRDPEQMLNTKHGNWYYEQHELGFNYRLNDLQASLGINQLKRIDNFIAERNKIAKQYDDIFKNNPYVITPKVSEFNLSAFHLYVVRIKERGKQFNRKNIFDKLRNSGFFVNVHYIPIYKQPYYQNKNFQDLKNSESYYEEALSLPIYPGLESKMIKKVKQVINSPIHFQNIF